MRMINRFFKNNVFLSVLSVVLGVYFLKNLFFDDQKKFEKLSTAGAKITDDQAWLRVNQIHEAFNFWNDDEEEIYKALSGINGGDFAKIYNFFGKRGYSLLETSTVFNPSDLLYTIRYFMSKNEVSEILRRNPLLLPFFQNIYND